MTAPARLTVTATRLAADPLAAARAPELLAAREHLGSLLKAAAGPAETPDDLEADIDLIVRYADQATFQPDTGDGKVALTALARVTALLAALPGGTDFAGRHWCARQPCARHPEAAAAGSRAAPAGQFLRKSTGSSYTPPELIAELLKSSLMPQVAEALTAAGPEKALAEVTVCDPACGAGAFLVAAARLLSWYTASTSSSTGTWNSPASSARRAYRPAAPGDPAGAANPPRREHVTIPETATRRQPSARTPATPAAADHSHR